MNKEKSANESKDKKYYKFSQNRKCEYFPCHKTESVNTSPATKRTAKKISIVFFVIAHCMH